MIPSASRYARCEEASHAVNPGLKLVIVRPAFGEGKTVCYLDAYEGGKLVASVPMDRGSLAAHDERIHAILLSEFRRG